MQTWQFTVVRNREKIQKLATVIREVLDRKGYNMYEPEALVIPSNLKESPYGREDDACAMENMFLAAHSLGIGSVWIDRLCLRGCHIELERDGVLVGPHVPDALVRIMPAADAQMLKDDRSRRPDAFAPRRAPPLRCG